MVCPKLCTPHELQMVLPYAMLMVLYVQKAKEQGDFLLVGLHTDEDVSERRGPHLPIMDLHERCLSVLACKYVDEVIIGTAA